MQLFQRKDESVEEDFCQYLTFFLDKQEFGFELSRIQEIRGFTPITPIPHAHPHVKGVINLRGVVLPVIDLRIKFGKPALEYTKFTVLIIAKVGPTGIGLVVDSVSDVLSLPPDSIAPAPELGGSLEAKVVQGLIKAPDRLPVLLNLDLLNDEILLPVGTDIQLTVTT